MQNRITIFRGKSKLDNTWLYGSLINNIFCKSIDKEPILYILDNNKLGYYDFFDDIADQLEDYAIAPETLGEWTGLYDDSTPKKMIFEGDILEENKDDHSRYEVIYKQHLCRFDLDCSRVSKATQYPGWNRGVKMEIIGNVYGNPELLKS